MTAIYLKLDAEYFAFIEELPSMNAYGRSLADAREALQALAVEVFAQERRTFTQTHSTCSIVREAFFLPAPKKA